MQLGHTTNICINIQLHNHNFYSSINIKMRTQKTQSQADIGFRATLNAAPGTNTFVFGILMILMQIAIVLIYAFLVWVPSYDYSDPVGSVNFTPIVTTVLLFLMVVVGFGGLFAYIKKLVWSALGFNLLIVCLSIEWFFLIYFFWLKTDIRNYSIYFSSGTWVNNIFLTNSIYKKIDDTLTMSAIGSCLTQALKCALANCIGFSAILGRAGPLEAFFIALFGTIGYELNRAIVQYVYWDYGGTYTVFTYGGFMSLMIGLILWCKQKNTRSTQEIILYTGSLFAGSISFCGAGILFAVFPIITADPERPWIVNGVTTTSQITTVAGSHIYFTVPLSIWYCMSSSLLVGSAFSFFVYEKLVARDFLHALVAGGVASCTAGVYFTNPVWPMVLGAATGMVQSLVQGIIEKKISMKKRIFHTSSFTMFGVQGIIGGIFASIFNAVVRTRNDGFTYGVATNDVKSAGYELAMACLSAAFGIAFGILIGLIVLCTARHERSDHFDDYTYWVPDDGLRYPKLIATPIDIPVVVPPPVVIDTDIFVKETTVNVKAKHAYL